MAKQEPAFSFRMAPEVRELLELVFETDKRIQTGTYDIRLGRSFNDTLNALVKVGAYSVRDHLMKTGGWDGVYYSLGNDEVLVMTALMSWFMANPDADTLQPLHSTTSFEEGPVRDFIDKHYDDTEQGHQPLTREEIAERYAFAIAYQKAIKRIVSHIDNMPESIQAEETAHAQAKADNEAQKSERLKAKLGLVRNSAANPTGALYTLRDLYEPKAAQRPDRQTDTEPHE